MDAVDQGEVLVARCYLYTFGQVVFGNEPSDELFAGIDPELLGQAVRLVGLSDDEGLAEALTVLQRPGQGAGLRSLYARLFEGPNKLAAPPWESVYRSHSRELFQRETLEVRNAYREQGFLPRAYPHVADDHISLELGFLAALAERARKAFADGEGQAAADSLAASSAFLENHVLAWIDPYCADLSAAAPGSLYALAASVLSAFARADARFLSACAAA